MEHRDWHAPVRKVAVDLRDRADREVLIRRWREHYNTVRPHSSLSYRPPAPEAILPRPAGLSYATLRPVQQDDHHRPWWCQSKWTVELEAALEVLRGIGRGLGERRIDDLFRRYIRGELEPAWTESLQFLNIALHRNCLTSFATEFDCRTVGLLFPFHAAWLCAGTRPFADDYLYARNWFGEGRALDGGRQDQRDTARRALRRDTRQ